MEAFLVLEKVAEVEEEDALAMAEAILVRAALAWMATVLMVGGVAWEVLVEADWETCTAFRSPRTMPPRVE